MTRRRLSKALCVLGVLTCMVAVIAPTAYGNGIVEGTTETLPVEAPDVPAVTQVTETVPEVEQVTTQVTQTTAPVTEPVEQVTNAPTGAAEDAVEETAASVPAPTTVQTSTSVSAPSTSGAVAQPSSPSGAVSTPSSDGGTSSTGTSTGSTTSTPVTERRSANPSAGGFAASPQQERMPTLSTASSFGSFQGPRIAAAGDKPGDVLDDLLDIGNSIGVDQVRGLQITNARGGAEPAAAPESESSSSAPAPLALTGMAIGAFLMIGSLLILVGNGARSAARVSAA